MGLRTWLRQRRDVQEKVKIIGFPSIKDGVKAARQLSGALASPFFDPPPCKDKKAILNYCDMKDVAARARAKDRFDRTRPSPAARKDLSWLYGKEVADAIEKNEQPSIYSQE